MLQRHVSVGFALLIALTATRGSAQEQSPAADAAQAEREREFAEQLTGAALVGRFTIDGKEGEAKPERYDIVRVSKLRDDYWVFLARIRYGEKDLTVPITLKVLWAGDTPMVSLTDLTIPGLGTFTSRVFFHGDRYAGTWQHGDVGGHLFGRIEKNAKEADGAAPQ